MNADVWSQDGSWKSVSDYCVTVTVSLENLTSQNIYIVTVHVTKLFSSLSKVILNDSEECISWRNGQHLIAIALKLSQVPEQCQRSNRSRGKGQKMFRRTRMRRAFSPSRPFRELQRPSSEFPFECLTCRLTHKSLITNHQDFLLQQKVITKRKEGYSMHPVIPTEENASELLAWRFESPCGGSLNLWS